MPITLERELRIRARTKRRKKRRTFFYKKDFYSFTQELKDGKSYEIKWKDIPMANLENARLVYKEAHLEKSDVFEIVTEERVLD